MTTTNATHKSKRLPITSSTLLFVIAIIFLASTLRTPLTGVGAVISSIRDGLGISNVLAGFLTTIPLLAFAVVSPFAPRISRRIGIEKTLFYSVILLTIGIILRSLGTTSLLIFGTALIGVAISFGNVLVPSFFKLKYPLQIGLLTGIYTVSMNISAAIAVGISNPIATNTAWGWQGALCVSVILTLITLVVWTPLLRGEKVNLATLSNSTTDVPEIKIWKKPLAWAIAISMGFQSLLFYCSISWVPEILVSQGYSADKAGWLTSMMQMAQIPMTFLIPIIAEKLRSQRPIVYMFTALYIIGFSGLLLGLTDFTAVWMICIGLAAGASFGIIMMLFTLRTKTAYEAAQISGFAQSIGYLLAAAGPVLFGLLHDTTGSWNTPNILFIISAIILFFTAFVSAKDRYL
ncbi:CynX/NimT family MFS transporter [Ureibacillus chungkukjangi]|uniref:CP family cyanate transporter-like MFS transporter n=1 Tax=Ureibacillus chungkukjangi TaxID=1202712 RepID=A0A318TN88_9BACL|nr:MFS transporter [Ureibacillus chungkukjangi]MCM3389592.1 MFS transporter [Ureibacillus chungkukjangi]PYF06351.1 CP family cyanate transporter-like MFS transporter [Ureibacillus chungkukjangi]